MAKYQLNQLFYYTGDVYSSPGLFKITAIRESNKYAPTSYDLKELAGERGFRGTYEAGMKDSYDGTCSYKFVTAKAYDDYMLKRHEKMIIIRTETTGEYELMDRLCRNMVNVKVYTPNDYPCRTCKQDQPQEETPKKKYKFKPRFFVFLPLAIVAALLLLIVSIMFVTYLWPDSIFTSNYWRGFI